MERDKVKNEYAILCRDAIVDQETNNVSLINLIEKITIQRTSITQHDKEGLKILPINLVLMSLWSYVCSEDSDYEVELTLKDPKEKILQSSVYNLKFDKNKISARLKIVMNGLKYTDSGKYYFTLSLKKDSEQRFQKTNEVSLNINIK